MKMKLSNLVEKVGPFHNHTDDPLMILFTHSAQHLPGIIEAFEEYEAECDDLSEAAMTAYDRLFGRLKNAATVETGERGGDE